MTKRIFLHLAFLILSGAARADHCGIGHITTIGEGRWNVNDFMISLDYAKEPSKHLGTEFNGLIVFKKTSLDIERFKGIKALAQLALSTDKYVMVYAHSGRCDDATEITLFK